MNWLLSLNEEFETTMTSPTTVRRRYYNATGEKYEVNRYGERHMEGYSAFRNATLLSILRDNFKNQKLRILEIGCGTGRSLEFLSRASAAYSLFGMDLSNTMLQQAAQKGTTLDNPPKLSIGDAGRLPYREGRFDAVFATRFIHQFPHDVKRELWLEFERVTRKGGLVIVEFYARPYHRLRYHLGGRKGRSAEGYFRHYPSIAEVREIAGISLQIYPLRLPGSRILAKALGETLMSRVTRVAGGLKGGLLLDEYFVVKKR